MKEECIIDMQLMVDFLNAHRKLIKAIREQNKTHVFEGDIKNSKYSVEESLHYLSDYLGRDIVFNLELNKKDY